MMVLEPTNPGNTHSEAGPAEQIHQTECNKTPRD